MGLDTQAWGILERRRLIKLAVPLLPKDKKRLHMPKKSPPLTDFSQLEQALLNRKFIPIEDGLRIKTTKGKKTFEARYRRHGISRSANVGTFPDDPIEVVRQRKEEFFKAVEAELKSGQIQKKEQTSPPKTQQKDLTRFSIKAEKHLWEILREMRLHRFFMGPEIESAILLMLLLPASPDEILDSKWEDVRGDWIAIDRSPEKPLPLIRNYAPKTRRFAWLSQAARETLTRLHESTGEKTYLFPKFQPMKPVERDRLLNDIFKDYWKPYEVRISGLQHTFTNLSKNYSQFNPEFIDVVMKKRYGRVERHQDFYDFQIKALLEWWGHNLWRLARAETYKSAYEHDGVDFRMEIVPNSVELHAQAAPVFAKSAFEINVARTEKIGADRSGSTGHPGSDPDRNLSPNPQVEPPLI